MSYLQAEKIRIVFRSYKSKKNMAKTIWNR